MWLDAIAAHHERADGVDAVVLQWRHSKVHVGHDLAALRAAAGDVPILVLCNVDEAKAARLAVRFSVVDFYVHTVLDPSMLPSAVMALLERARIEDELFDEKERAQLTLNSIGDAVMSIDVDYRVTFLNKAAEGLTGWVHDAALGHHFNEVLQIVKADSGIPVVNPLVLALKNDVPSKLPPNCNLVRRDRSELGIEDTAAPIHSRRGAVKGAVIVFRDVSAARAASKQLSFLAQHDPLTELPNRTVLYDRLKQSAVLASRSGRSFAVLFVDVDRFKHINDSLGHRAGDAVLRTLGRRLAATVRASDTVSRHGGDEFVVLLASLDESLDAGHCAEKLLEAARLPVVHDGVEINVTASVGIAIFPQDGANAEALLQSADSAMYQAKHIGRNTFQFYRRHFNSGASERRILEGDLRRAGERNELVLHYQPKVKLATCEWTGFEALIRWNHPQRGLVPPVEFVAIAEETGLIIPIGRWVLQEACRQAVLWRGDSPTPLRMAVNVSALELRSQDYVGSVRDTLIETGMNPALLELEITETFLLQDSSATARVLRALKELGIRLALDDFGTGYSSLSFMRRFSIDVLKVDHSFVRDVTTSSQDACVVKAIIHMARSMQMEVVAEGVETDAQLRFLLDNGCTDGQGYYFSKALPPTTLTHQHGHVAPCVGIAASM